MFNAFVGLVKDTAKIVDATVEVPLGLVRTITKPMGDAMEEFKDDVLDACDLDDE